MAFNSYAYHANRSASAAWNYLAQARALKARVAADEAYDWESPRLAFLVSMARSNMRQSLNYRKLWKIGREMRGRARQMR